MMWNGGWSGVDWVLMGVGMLVFWTIVVAVVLWLVANRRRADSKAAPPSAPAAAGPRGSAGVDARTILDQRLARGDLTSEDYQARRDLLTPQ